MIPPQLNVIEDLWQHLKARIYKRRFFNKMELKQVLIDEWNEIVTEKLVRSLPQRLTDVVRNENINRIFCWSKVFSSYN